MKLLQYTVFRSCQHQVGGPVGELCHFNVFNLSMSYAGILGILGLFLSLYDMLRILWIGNALPCNVIRAGVKVITDFLTPQLTRDFTLIGTVISVQCYAFLMLGSIKRNRKFFIPWMCYYSVIIMLEFAAFLMGIFKKGIVFNRHSLVISIFIVYNWLAIFCAYIRFGNEKSPHKWM